MTFLDLYTQKVENPFYKQAVVDALTEDECSCCFESVKEEGVDEMGFGIACGCAKLGEHSNPSAFEDSLNAEDNCDM